MHIHTFLIPHDHPGHDGMFQRSGGAFIAKGTDCIEHGFGHPLDVIADAMNIGICAALADALTDEELNAVVAHEYGHGMLNHVEVDRGGDMDMFVEMEADMFGSRVSGAAAMWSALVQAGATFDAIDSEPLQARLSTLFAQI